MDYNKLNELKAKYGDYEEVFKSGDYDKAADILKAVLDVIEDEYKGVRKAGMIDKDLVVRKSEGTGFFSFIFLKMRCFTYISIIITVAIIFYRSTAIVIVKCFFI